MTIMATSAYLSQGGGPPSSDQEEGVMNLVNTSNSQGYSLPREQVVGFRTSISNAENLGTYNHRKQRWKWDSRNFVGAYKLSKT